MRYHQHINSLTFFLPFNLVAYALVPYTALLIARRSEPEPRHHC